MWHRGWALLLVLGACLCAMPAAAQTLRAELLLSGREAASPPLSASVLASARTDPTLPRPS